MSKIDLVIEEFNKLPEVIRVKELEKYIDNNTKINSLFTSLKDKQKQMVNAKEHNQLNQYKIYKEEYNVIYNNLLDMPFVEEYLELLDIINNYLNDFSYIIEKQIKLKIEE